MTFSLQGGYKSYRRWVLQRLEKNCHFRPLTLCVLGGLTGSGKTAILQALQQIGEQVIDLEFLAKHQGSAFGGINQPKQPTQEHFENELALTIEKLDTTRPIWIEDESRLIGRCHLPTSFYENILHSPLFHIQLPLSDRLRYLLSQYGRAPKEHLLEATKRIAKRLGDQRAKYIQGLIENEQNEQAFEQLLVYYDKAYHYQMTKRKIIYSIPNCSLSSPMEWAYALQTFYRQKFS